MNSITLKEVLEKAACRIVDDENLVYGELDSAMTNLTRVLLEAMAESEVEKRSGVRLHERSETRCDHRNGYRHRKVQMSYQVVEVRIPRLRGQGFVPSFLNQPSCYRRSRGLGRQGISFRLVPIPGDTASGIDNRLPAIRRSAGASPT